MLALFIIAILVALGLQWYSLRNAGDHRNIRYSCRPSVRAAEPGEVFVVHSDVSNLGRRPSPSIRIEEHFPRNLTVVESAQFNGKWLTKDHRIYYSTVLIRGHQQVKRSLRASISQRGEYSFSYADFYAGDFLGFREYEYRMENDSRIVIYPARLKDDTIIKAFSQALDQLARKKQLLEDPISVRGYREYTGVEPMRQISWNQSAMRNALIVKQFDPVWQPSVLIALDTQLHGDFDPYIPQQELCYSLTRSICEQLEQRQIGYQLITNAPVTGQLAGFSSNGGMGGSYQKILYALGSAKNGSICSIEELTRAACSIANRRELIVLISTHSNERVENALNKVRRFTRGQIVTLFADQLLPILSGSSEEGREEP